MIIGWLKYEAGVYTGEIDAINFITQIIIHVPDGSTAASGGFEILNQRHREIGLAWVENDTGLCLKFDSPALPKPAYCWLIDTGPNTYSVAWMRPEL